MKTLVGTPYYVAPEVLEGKYGNECDCWSLGVIMYALLSGCLPFYGNNSAEVYERIKQAKISFNFKEFLNISESAKDLITKLLTKDINERFSCAQALTHPWFQKADSDKGMKLAINPKIIERIRNYKGVSSLKKEAMNVLVKMVDPKKIENLRTAFHAIDKDQTGMITV